jgi:hypothetical protein
MSTIKTNNISNLPGNVTVNVENIDKGIAKAWCVFDGSHTTPTSTLVGFNVSSITDSGVGRYTVNFTTPMIDTNYAPTGAVGSTFNTGLSFSIGNDQVPPLKTVSSCKIYMLNFSGNAIDPQYVSFAVFR